jgi:hypothetical protein
MRGLLGGLEGVVGFKQRLAPRNAAEVEICGR